MSCVPSPIVSRPRISMNHIFAEEKARGREALSNAMMEYILDKDTGEQGETEHRCRPVQAAQEG